MPPLAQRAAPCSRWIRSTCPGSLADIEAQFIGSLAGLLLAQAAAARRLLMRAGLGDDVTQVALRLGFGHAGRFAAPYRQAFGESPSQSLRRAAR